MKIQEIYIQFTSKGKVESQTFEWQETIEYDFFILETQSSEDRFVLEIQPKKELLLHNFSLRTKRTLTKDEHYLVNGYQTWTDSREFVLGESIYGLRSYLKPINNHYRFKSYGDYFFWDYANKANCFHSYSFTHFRQKEEIEFWASLNEKNGFTIFYLEADEQRFSIIKDCKDLVISQPYQAFDLFYQKGSQTDCWENYEKELVEKNGLKIKENKVISGWTSWYNYYTNITPKIIKENLAAFASRKIPIDVFQIDDGYQQAVGDWEPKDQFKNMRNLPAEIHKKGYKAGLWIAPFICEEKSKLKQEHPDWILKDKKGKEVVVGYSPGWSGKFYALDFENESVKSYLQKVFHRALHKWGFDMLKLDFLYAVCMSPKAHKTKGQVMSEAMHFLRRIAGDKILLGCGVPLASAYGLVDYCRIGADVALKWEDKLLADIIRYRERVSTLASLHSTISRNPINGRFFGNDPDVSILREENNKLTVVQKNTLFILNQLLGSLLFISDNVNEYNEQTLEQYLKQFPQKKRDIISIKDEGDLYVIRFKIDDFHYCLCANLSEQERVAELPEGAYFSSNDLKFYKEKISLPPFETQCLRKTQHDIIEVIGSTGHLFPGAEIKSLEYYAFNITIEKEKQALPNAITYIRVPMVNMNYWVNEEIFKSQEIDGKAVLKYTN